MQLVDIIIDKRISCTFINDSGVENVIFCRPLEENLNNISLISTKNDEFIHSYIEESTGKYLITSISLEDGTVYENVHFKLITIEEGKELPASTINFSLLGVPSATDVLPHRQILEEKYTSTLNEVQEDDDFSVLYEVPEVIDNSEIVQKVKALENKLTIEQQKLEQDRIKLNKERTILEADRKLQKTLEDYKSELLQETFLLTTHQKDLLERSINDLNESFQQQFDSQQINVEKYLDTLAEANLEVVKKYQDVQVSKIKDSINNLLTERLNNNTEDTNRLLIERAAELEALFTEKLITELEEHKRNVKVEIDGIDNTLDNIIGEKLKENNDNVDQLLVSRAGILQEQFNEKLAKDLTDYKGILFDEFKTVSSNTASKLFTEKTEELNSALTIVLDEHKNNLNTTVTSKINEISSTVNSFKTEIDGKLPQLDDTIKEINKRIQTLVIEKKNVQSLADDARKYTDIKVAQVSEDIMNYARRILDLGGGGGSNAVQYANGGTMNGDLNVTGQYLSGGINLATIFSQGGGNGDLAVNTLVRSNSGYWNTAYTVATTYQNASGNWQSTYGTVSLLSANWSSAYNISTAYQNASGSFITAVSGTVNQINASKSGSTVTLSLPSNVVLPGNVTILGNISAQGTATFANTVFTTTSALCAVANSSGPALYIGQSGSGDLASFYDLSPTPVEVLHVGASTGIPGVGIYTSTPNTELTVVGNISGTAVIYASGGNSNNWNSTYTTVNANSATNWNYQGTDIKALSGNWQSTYTTVSSNSANWSSVYSFINTTSATNNSAYNATTFSKLSTQAYTFVPSFSSIQPTFGGNAATSPGTIVLSHLNSGNYYTIFKDSSYYNHGYFVPNGSDVTGFTVDTTTYISGTASLRASGAGAGAVILQNPTGDLNIGYNDFTIELWVHITSWTPEYLTTLLTFDSNPSTGGAFYILLDGNLLAVYGFDGAEHVANTSISVGTWAHLAVTRQSGLIRMFVNGVLGQSFNESGYISANNANNYNYSNYKGIGLLDNDAGTQFNGNISELRIIKGAAIYTSSFTVPTPPLSAINPSVFSSSLVTSGSANNALGYYSTILNGANNQTINNFDIVGSGNSNTASGYYSAVINGCKNIAWGTNSSIINGCGNCICNSRQTLIGNGICNTASSYGVTILNGCCNNTCGRHSTILNGRCNTVGNSNYSWIGGGCLNNAGSLGVGYNTVLNGNCNTSSTYSDWTLFGNGTCNSYTSPGWGPFANYNTFLNGNCNTISSGLATFSKNSLLNGSCNCIIGTNSGSYGTSVGINNTIANGTNNKICIISTGYYDNGSCSAYNSTASVNNSIILGGCINQICENNQTVQTTTASNYSTIANGVSGFIGNNSSFSSLLNGCYNCISSSNFSTIENGICNIVSGTYSCNSTIVNGCKNCITSFNSTIVNGTNNIVRFDNRTTSNLLLLYHFDNYTGTASTPTFTNSSITGLNQFTSFNGSVSAVSSLVKFGTGAVQLASAVAYSNRFIPFSIGTNNFSVDFWYYIPNTMTGGQNTFVASNAAGNAGGPNIYISNTSIYYRNSLGGSNLIAGSIALGQYNHIALGRYSNVVTLYVNGVAQGTYTDTSNFSTANYIWFGGTGRVQNFPAVGTIDEFRFYNGYSAYTGSNFAPPTTPYAIGSSSILGGYNNNIIGDSSYLTGNFNSISATNAFVLGTGIVAATDNYTYVNNLSSQGVVAATNLTINSAPSTFVNPVTASGTFLIVNVNGTNQAIQLWNYLS